MSEVKRTEEEITREGNPRKPQGEEGKVMLDRMNHSHYEVTGWALAHWKIKGDDQILDIGCGGGANPSPDDGAVDDWSCDWCGLFWCVC